MSFCVKCGYRIESDDKFCFACGAPVAGRESEPAPVAAPYPVVQPGLVPVMTEPPRISVKTKVLGFVGMGLSIGGFVIAILGILYTMIFMEIPPAGAVFAFYLSVFSMPLSIVGRILSKKSQAGNNQSRVCTVGSSLGLAGIIISAVMLFLGFTNLMVY